jgi:hypothetical protein
MASDGNTTVVKPQAQGGKAELNTDFAMAAVAMACLAGKQKATINQMSLALNDLGCAEIESVHVPLVVRAGQKGFYCEQLELFMTGPMASAPDKDLWVLTEEGRDRFAEIIAAAFGANPVAAMKAADEVCLDWEEVVVRGIRVIKAKSDRLAEKDSALAGEKR